MRQYVVKECQGEEQPDREQCEPGQAGRVDNGEGDAEDDAEHHPWSGQEVGNVVGGAVNHGMRTISHLFCESK